jgi:hypothetical protein
VKVHIVHLDSHDDTISARDKLSWAKSPRVLIVWPKYGNVLTRRLDLVLLQRFATQHSLQIGLVTHDADVLDNAEILAIPTFESLDDVSDSGWRRRARHRPKPAPAFRKRKETPQPKTSLHDHSRIGRPSSQNKYLRFLLPAVTLILLLFLALLLTSNAELIISPATEAQTVEFVMRLDTSLDSPGAEGEIPGQLLTVRVSDQIRLPTSGEVAIPASPSRGFVTFTNLTSNDIDIDTGTGLRATNYDNQRFVTLESVLLPGEIGAQAEAEIEAIAPGPSGNLPTGAIDAIEGTLGLQVEVTNIIYLSGGENEVRAAVSEADFSRAENDLQKILEDQALQQLNALLFDDLIFLDNSLHLIQIHDRTFDRELGEPADTLGLTMEIEFGAYAFRHADAQVAASNILAHHRPSGFLSIPASFGFEVMHDNLEIENGYVDITTQAWQDIYKPVDKDTLRRILQWEKPARALSLVSQEVTLTEAPTLFLSPSWLPRIPFLRTQISILYSWQVNP